MVQVSELKTFARLCAIVLASILLIGVGISCPAFAQGDSMEMLARSLANREKLVSGRCVIKGKSKRSGDAELEERRIDVDFDFAIPAFRFIAADEGSTIWEPKFIYTAPKTGNEVRRHDHGRIVRSGTATFDIRTIGFYSGPNDALRSPGINDFKLMKKRYLGCKMKSRQQEDGLEVLTLSLPKHAGDHYTMVKKLWLDPAKGYSVTRVQELDGKGFLYQSDIEWKERDGVWLPTSLKQKNGSGIEMIDWKIKWTSANKGVPKEFFHPRMLANEFKRVTFFTLDFPSNEPIYLGVFEPK